MPSKKPDPQPEHGKDNEPGRGHGRPVTRNNSAPVPSRPLSEIDFEFWFDITKP